MFYADLHIHSKYSRATSKNCDLKELALWGAKKGLGIISTGDFTHPAWFNEIKENLNYLGDGTFELKDEIKREVFRDYPNLSAPKFLLSVEISTIYKAGDKTRKVHHVVFCPDIESASKFRDKLGSIGNIKSDGRPILGITSRNLLEIALLSSDDAYIIPAHIWTPWFSVLGSKSGYDSIEDCYEDLSEHIFALETGLSSDPYMNWRVSKLDRYRLVSNSDAHSPSKLAREATVFDCNIDYFSIKSALKDGNGYVGTVEFFPEEGKYHQDGHRKCGVCLESSETKKLQGICPVCHKPLTIGVSYRVEELADRFGDFEPPKTAGEVFSLVPLNEILSEIMGVGPSSKKVEAEYERLIRNLGSELSVLQEVELEKIEKQSVVLKEAIDRLRKGNVIKEPGYDGEYGVIKLFREGEASSFLNMKLDIDIAPIKKEKKEIISHRSFFERTKEIVIPEVKFEQIKPDAAQLSAIESDKRQLLIIAGPGSGKTSVLTKRISYLINEKNIESQNCLAITFTKKAAFEMKQRLEKLLEQSSAQKLNIHTFHSLCFQILKQKGEVINLPNDFKIITKEEKSLYKEGEIPSNCLDFDDLIDFTLKLFYEHPQILEEYRHVFKYIFVDEYQDIDEKQYRLIKFLAPADADIFAIGDPNQAIYGFRGGSAEFFNNFSIDYKDACVINLKNNYRSEKNIVDASSQMINCFNICAKLKAADKITFHKAPTEKAEAEFIVSTIERLIGGDSFFSIDSNRASGFENEENFSFSDFAILYRSKTQLAPIIEALERKAAPYASYSDELLINKKPIRNLLLNLTDEKPLYEQILSSRDKFDIEDNIFNYLVDFSRNFSSGADFIHEISFLNIADTFDKNADRISLMTLHASKGLEFKCVFIAGVEEGLMPFYLAKEDEIEEEKRLLYVGMTRAKKRLFLSYCEKRNIRGEYKLKTASRFLCNIQNDLLQLSQFEKIHKNNTSQQLTLF